MFKQRSCQKELLDDALLQGEELHENLKEINRVNKWLGGNSVTFSALRKVIEDSRNKLERSHFILADLGCGDGYMLRTISDWKRGAHYQLQLQGCDINLAAIEQAKINSIDYPHIVYEKLDVFSEEFTRKRFDIVMMNLFAHHLTDEQLIILMKQLKNQTRVALIINDLHRHWVPYFAIKYLTRLLPCSHLIKHDAPLSVRRGFTKKELRAMLYQCGFHSFDISWFWAFRWRVIIWL